MSGQNALTWVACSQESVVSVCLLLSSLWHLEEDVASASPSHLASSGPSPTPLSVASSPSRAPALFPSLSPSAVALSRGDPAPSLCHDASPEGRGHVLAPAEINKD